MNGLRVVRKISGLGTRRTFISKGAFENENKINAVRQKFYTNPATGAENPTYLKENGDKAIVALAFAGIGAGICLALNGLFNMSFGLNKKQ
eukprot:CAMPEP_0181288912 /NCGR_PEP_ID=MMETSP1101-20121128/599_1 /TAXON_ID=46948 /ORGANISM="Rhodomonas abbreviata, Strain Caron Lab Isolate" /LENGTH=90 /DNA_ID=CAMNT_0023393093 /DNA_START=62 /DNA_END=334 /DNA_ORIENTATION=-